MALASAIDAALRDDPLGGRDLSYRALLLRHMQRFRVYSRDALRQGVTGRVLLRFRVDRSGRVLDAQVIASSAALLNEGALETLWRAEPVPPVPPGLPSPLEIELPIEFDMTRRLGG